jgi:catechol 2,3-dioxygenase-like lactoylglutathione lyase family enzyme
MLPSTSAAARAPPPPAARPSNGAARGAAAGAPPQPPQLRSLDVLPPRSAISVRLRCRAPAATAAAAGDAGEAASSSASSSAAAAARDLAPVPWTGVHHVAVIVADLPRALDFYCGVLGLEVNPARPHDKLPYGGAWLWVGPEMVHLMELPNPDPLDGRPEHGGRDRHACVGVAALAPLAARLEAAGVPFTRSRSGRPALFFRDPDANTLEVAELEAWR